MPSLAESQGGFARALREGPDAMPDGLLAGEPAYNLLAMAAYANTISHGRLVAMEDVFPTCRSAMGDAAFNTASRRYVEDGWGVDVALDRIGDDFPHWLERTGHPADLVAVARFDLAFLEAYHAPDVPPVSREALPTDPAQLVSMPMTRHVAASMHGATSLLCTHAMIDGEAAAALLLSRPDLTVRCTAVDDAVVAAWTRLDRPVTFGDLMANMVADYDDATAIGAMMRLIDCGGIQTGD